MSYWLNLADSLWDNWSRNMGGHTWRGRYFCHGDREWRYCHRCRQVPQGEEPQCKGIRPDNRYSYDVVSGTCIIVPHAVNFMGYAWKLVDLWSWTCWSKCSEWWKARWALPFYKRTNFPTVHGFKICSYCLRNLIAGPHLITGNGVGFKPDILDMDVMEKVLEVMLVNTLLKSIMNAT